MRNVRLYWFDNPILQLKIFTLEATRLSSIRKSLEYLHLTHPYLEANVVKTAEYFKRLFSCQQFSLLGLARGRDRLSAGGLLESGEYGVSL